MMYSLVVFLIQPACDRVFSVWLIDNRTVMRWWSMIRFACTSDSVVVEATLRGSSSLNMIFGTLINMLKCCVLSWRCKLPELCLFARWTRSMSSCTWWYICVVFLRGRTAFIAVRCTRWHSLWSNCKISVLCLLPNVARGVLICIKNTLSWQLRIQKFKCKLVCALQWGRFGTWAQFCCPFWFSGQFSEMKDSQKGCSSKQGQWLQEGRRHFCSFVLRLNTFDGLLSVCIAHCPSPFRQFVQFCPSNTTIR